MFRWSPSVLSPEPEIDIIWLGEAYMPCVSENRHVHGYLSSYGYSAEQPLDLVQHIHTYAHTSVHGYTDMSNSTHQPRSQDQSCSCSVSRAINNFSIVANLLNWDSNQVSRPLLIRLSGTR